MNKHIILTEITVALLALSTAAHAVMFPIVVTKKVATEPQSFTNTIDMTFNPIPAGTFTMGSNSSEPGRDSDETQHEVTLTESFYMQITEVTQKQWQGLIGNNPSGCNTGDNYPVENVNWYEAIHFANLLSLSENRSECYTLSGCTGEAGEVGNHMECDNVVMNDQCTGYRLPTEAQWEYAARATTTTAYANPVYFDNSNTEISKGFNPNLAAMGWYPWNDALSGGYPTGTKPVAVKQANKWGLFDLHGNVWEWCQDHWEGLDYSSYSVTDPQGGTSGSRVIRGGSWGSDARIARSANRGRCTPSSRSRYIGFRLIVLNQ